MTFNDCTAAQQSALEEATKAALNAQLTGSHQPTQGQVLVCTVTPVGEPRSFTSDKPADATNFCTAASQCTGATYLRPTTPGHPVIDACIWPDTLLRYTVTPSPYKALDEAALEKHLQCLPVRGRYFLDYLVPPDVYLDFKVAPLSRHATHTRVNKVHTQACNVDSQQPQCTATLLIVFHTGGGHHPLRHPYQHCMMVLPCMHIAIADVVQVYVRVVKANVQVVKPIARQLPALRRAWHLRAASTIRTHV